MRQRKFAIACRGRLPSGKRAGSRHRWNCSGINPYCIWCNKYKDEVFVLGEARK